MHMLSWLYISVELCIHVVYVRCLVGFMGLCIHVLHTKLETHCPTFGIAVADVNIKHYPTIDKSC